MKNALVAVDGGGRMWWRSMALGSVVMLGCSGPNPLFGHGLARDGGLADALPMETGPEAPVADVPAMDTVGEAHAEVVDTAVVEATPGPDLAAETTLPADVATPVDQALPSTLVGYWRLDEKVGTTALDSSGNGHHGVLEALTAASWTDTPRGGGLTFTRNLNSGVRVGSVNAVPARIQALTRFTIAAWTFRGTGNTGQHLTVMSRQRQGNTEIFSVALDNTLAKLYMYPDQPGNTLEANGVLTVGAAGGAWVHLAATFDGSEMRVYIDGVLGNGPRSYAGAVTSSQFPLYLGTNKNDPAENQPFDGILDEVLLFSEALGVDAVRRVRNGDLGGI